MSSIKLAGKNAIKFLLQWYAPKPTIEQIKLMHITIKMIGYDRYPTFIAQVMNVLKHAGSTYEVVYRLELYEGVCPL